MDFTPTLRQMGLCTAPAVPTGRQWLISQRKMACCLQSALGLVCVQLRNNFLALCLGVTARFRAGYSDARVRPWNQRNTKDRRGGQYYRESWSAAAALNPSFISITSWNEWHEGTQIEDCMCVYCVVCCHRRQVCLCHHSFIPQFSFRPASLANAQSEMQDIASSSPYMCD
jgi:hypothetical protein